MNYSDINALIKAGKAQKLFIVHAINPANNDCGFCECSNLADAKQQRDLLREHDFRNIKIVLSVIPV